MSRQSGPSQLAAVSFGTTKRSVSPVSASPSSLSQRIDVVQGPPEQVLREDRGYFFLPAVRNFLIPKPTKIRSATSGTLVSGAGPGAWHSEVTGSVHVVGPRVRLFPFLRFVSRFRVFPSLSTSHDWRSGPLSPGPVERRSV